MSFNLNRNSTPDASASSSLRPPSSRAVGSGHIMRASADMGAFAASSAANRIRPSSEVLGNQNQSQQRHSTTENEVVDQAVQEWLQDVDNFELTLNEMAQATMDQDFKDELRAIEKWFKVLTEAERTAALYSLLQQTTQVQARFFITVLQHNSRQQPNISMLSPSSLEKDTMASKLTDAMEALKVTGSRTSFARPLPSPSAKRNSGLSTQTVHKMFPEAAAAIQNKRDSLMQQANSRPTSLLAPSLSSPQEEKASFQTAPSAWERSAVRPKSSELQQPMGQFAHAPPSAGLRSPRGFPNQLGGSGPGNIKNTTVNAPHMNEVTEFSPLPAMNNGSWASQMNTPMVANFNTHQHMHDQQQQMANTSAMKMAAISTVNSRISLDDAKKFRKSKSPNEGPTGLPRPPLSPGVPQSMIHPQLVMTNDQGMVMSSVPLTQVQAANALLSGQRSRPNSPGIAFQGAVPGVPYPQIPQQSGYLQTPFLNTPGMTLGQFGSVDHGYLSDHSDAHQRGRSPRGRRGSSRPPEDPTDMTLLQDVPNWLRSLRLHKYTDNLKDMRWQDLVQLDDAGLEAKGVAAVGARRKMLKIFMEVNQAIDDGKLN